MQRRFRVPADELRVNVSPSRNQQSDRFRDARKMSGPISCDVQHRPRLSRRANTRRCEFGMFYEQARQRSDVTMMDRRLRSVSHDAVVGNVMAGVFVHRRHPSNS